MRTTRSEHTQHDRVGRPGGRPKQPDADLANFTTQNLGNITLGVGNVTSSIGVTTSTDAQAPVSGTITGTMTSPTGYVESAATAAESALLANPTPFDVAHELTTRSDQAEVLRALQIDPPIVIVGDYLPLIGDDAHRYVDAHWKRESVPGYSGVVRRYQSPLPAAGAAP